MHLYKRHVSAFWSLYISLKFVYKFTVGLLHIEGHIVSFLDL